MGRANPAKPLWRANLRSPVAYTSRWTIRQAELNRRKSAKFIDKAFENQVPSATPSAKGELLHRICAGGYPEALARGSERRRSDWYRAYVESIVERDVPDIASISKPAQIPPLLQIAAQFSSQLTNLSELGRAVALDHKTTETYLRTIEQLFLVRRIQPWSRNELSRVIKTPKLHFLDSGLLTAMRGYSLKRLSTNRDFLGPLLETFVFSELLKLASWSDEYASFYYFRDKDKNEVDFVLENAAGDIVGIEVKAAASVARRDFKGLERLASLAGPAFVQGIVLYDGEQTLSFTDKMRAAPISVLWA